MTPADARTRRFICGRTLSGSGFSINGWLRSAFPMVALKCECSRFMNDEFASMIRRSQSTTAGTTMLLNRLLFIASVFGACAYAFAAEVHCPPSVSARGKTFPLADASVFDGPPEEHADLMPDLETSEWDIATDQKAGKTPGRSLYLVCRYSGSQRTVSLRIPRDATRCKVEGIASGRTVAWCKAASRRTNEHDMKGVHGHQSQNPDRQAQ